MGITAAGVNLKNAPRIYGIAADPRVLPMGSRVEVSPNPFGYRGAFRVFDTGGAIKGNRIDFYDWRGRKSQLGWGRRSVVVSRPGADGGSSRGSSRPSGPSYPLGQRGQVIGTPHAGTHNLGNWQSDNAIDIKVPVGTDAIAVDDGVITKVKIVPNGGGRFAGSQVTLKTRTNAYFYTHLSAVTVKQGQRVKRGQKIGESGSANGVPHLHIGQQRGNARGLQGFAVGGSAGGSRRGVRSRLTGGGASARGSGSSTDQPTAFEERIADADLGIAEAEARARGAEVVGGSPAAIAQANAISAKRKLIGERIRAIRKALRKRGLRTVTKVRLQNELAQLLGEHSQLGAQGSALRTAPVAEPAEGSGEDPNQALIDSNQAVVDAINAAAEAAAQQAEDQRRAAEELAAALRAAEAAINAQVAFADRVSAITSMEAVRVVADVLSRQFGAVVAHKQHMPGTGSLSRL